MLVIALSLLLAVAQPALAGPAEPPYFDDFLWEKIAAAPGQNLRIHRSDQLRGFAIKAGDSAHFLLPTGRVLRLELTNAQATEFVVLAGDGGGLFAPQNLQRQSERLWVLPATFESRHILIANRAIETMTLQVLQGRQSVRFMPPLALSSNLNGAGKAILFESSQTRRHYVQAAPGQPATFSDNGRPGRLITRRLGGMPVEEINPLTLTLSHPAGTETRTVATQAASRQPLLLGDCWHMAGPASQTIINPLSSKSTQWRIEPDSPSVIRFEQPHSSWHWRGSNHPDRDWPVAEDAQTALTLNYQSQLRAALASGLPNAESLALYSTLRATGTAEPLLETSDLETFWRRQTFWRSLSGKAINGPSESLRAKVRRLRAPRSHSQASPPAFDRASAQRQVELAPTLDWLRLQPGNPVDFALPERHVDSQLRIWVLLEADIQTEQQLGLVLDHQQPRWLVLRPMGELSARNFDNAVATLQTLGAAELATGGANGPSQQRLLTQLLQFPLVDAVQSTLSLGHSVNKLRLQLPPDNKAIWIAAQYRTPRSAALTEAKALQLINQPASLWNSLQAALRGLTVGDGEQEIHLAPLQRLIQARAETFLNDIEADQPVNRPWAGNGTEKSAVSALPNAVHSWSDILSTLESQFSLGLRRRLLKGLAIYGTTAAVRDPAGRLLASELQQESSPLAWQGLLAVRIREHGDQQALLALATSLSAQGDVRMAFLAALAAPPGRARQLSLNELALLYGWSPLSPQSRDNTGVHDSVAVEKLKHTNTGANLRHDDGVAALSLRQPWPTAPSQHAGQYMIYSPERETYFSRWSTSADASLRLPVSGPAKIHLTLRPLHLTADGRLDTDVKVTAGNRTQIIAVHYNAVRNKLQVVGDPRRAGDAVRQTIHLGDGDGILEISSPIPLLIGIEASDDSVTRKLRPRMTPNLSRWLADPVWRREPPVSIRTVSDCRLVNQTTAVLLPEQALMAAPDTIDLLVEEHHGDEIQSLSAAWREFPDQRGTLWQQALAVANQGQDAVETAAALRRLGRGRWQRLDQVLRSSGLVTETVSGWDPESPTAAMRRNLLQPERGDWLVGADRVATLVVDLLEPTDLGLEFRLKRLPFAVRGSAQLRLTIGDQDRFLTVQSSTPSRQDFSLPAGIHEIRAQRLDRWDDREVLARALRHNGDRWESIERTLQRDYHVSTVERPLVVYLDEPVWLRINTWDGQNHAVTYRIVGAAGELELPPPTGSQQAFYRVFGYQPKWDDEERPPPEIYHRAITRARLPLSAKGVEDALPNQIRVAEHVRPPGGDNGTRGLGLGFQRRLELDDAGSDELEEFTQLDLTWRKQLANRDSHWQGEVMLREHLQGAAVVGTRHWYEWRPQHSPWQFQIFGSAYLQQDQATDRGARSYFLRARSSRRVEWSDRWRHRSELNVFARHLNAIAEQVDDFRLIDQDVATRYKLAHKNGWSVSERLIWRWRLDSELYWDAGLRGNEWGDNLLDQFSVTAGWRNYLGGLTVDAGLRTRRFFDDDDRTAASTNTRLFASFEWLDWPAANWGWRARLGLVYDIERGETSAQLRLAWFDDDGRGTRDFRPNSLAFRRLHNRRLQWRDARHTRSLESVVP